MGAVVRDAGVKSNTSSCGKINQKCPVVGKEPG